MPGVIVAALKLAASRPNCELVMRFRISVSVGRLGVLICQPDGRVARTLGDRVAKAVGIGHEQDAEPGDADDQQDQRRGDEHELERGGAALVAAKASEQTHHWILTEALASIGTVPLLVRTRGP